jgi:copper chaperone CopZ
MKNILLLCALSVAVFACKGTNTKPESESEEVAINTAAVKTIHLNVSGMTCEGCENTIETSLAKLDGVVTVEALHKEGVANISYDTTKVNVEVLSQTINSLGYKAVN